LDNRSGMRCGWRKSGRCSAVPQVRRPAAFGLGSLRRGRRAAPVLRPSARRCRPAWQ
jgi:hypothetical protein